MIVIFEDGWAMVLDERGDEVARYRIKQTSSHRS
jgi:hypothetical protein